MATETVNERISVAEARNDLDAVIARAQETKQPIVVTRDGDEAVIIIDALRYHQNLEKIACLRGIIAGLNAVIDGNVVSMEDVEARLDAILAE